MNVSVASLEESSAPLCMNLFEWNTEIACAVNSGLQRR